MSPDAVDLASATITAVVWLAYWLIDQRKRWPARTLGFWACWYAVIAAWNTIDNVAPVTTLMDGGFAGWCAYHAWKRRKPRQRKPSKVGARVRDLGHRLVVSHS